MEAAFAFNVSSEEFGLHMKNRFVFMIELNGMLHRRNTYWYQLVKVIITYRVAVMNTTWNIDHEYATLFSSLSHTLWLSSVEIGFDSSLSVKTEYSEQKDKKNRIFDTFPICCLV